jgi:hypothetical protein
MSANLEWEIPFSIISSYGELFLNESTPYLLLGEGCEALRRLRVVVDDIPQGDGQINHKRFTSGYEIQLEVALWNAARDAPLCDQEARLAAEDLMLHLNAVLNGSGRLIWTPTGLGDRRFLDEARLAEIGPWTTGNAFDSRIVFRLDSPFPYVMDLAQVEVELVDTVDQVITNNGTVTTFPVVRVDGPATAFDIDNLTTGESVHYDEALPGALPILAGHYIEFDFFRNTAYFDGSGDPAKAGIVIETSDFWSLDPQIPTTVGIFGASGTLLYNHSYA